MLRPYKARKPELNLSGDLGGNLRQLDVGEGIFVFAPGFEAALEGTNASDALFSEEERHTGARSFVWSSAVEDDFTIMRQQIVFFL
jgi:hypothetical protein